MISVIFPLGCGRCSWILTFQFPTYLILRLFNLLSVWLICFLCAWFQTRQAGKTLLITLTVQLDFGLKCFSVSRKVFVDLTCLWGTGGTSCFDFETEKKWDLSIPTTPLRLAGCSERLHCR